MAVDEVAVTGSSHSSLSMRQAIRQAIMGGDIKGATERIQAAGYSKVSGLEAFRTALRPPCVDQEV